MHTRLVSPVLALCLALVGFGLISPLLHAQQSWRWANSLPASNQWKDVAYGNGVAVVVGLDATIATSSDGASWTIRRMGTSGMTLNGVAFAGGRFVAVGMGTPTSLGAALIMTSTDGIDWTINSTVASTFNAQLGDVTFGGGTWVVSGFGGVSLLSSSDGLTWSARGGAGISDVGSGTYGAGRFVCAGNNNTIVTSVDGTTWTRNIVAGASGASSPLILDVTFGAGKFVAVGRDSNFNAAVYTSTDATTWTAVASITNSSNGFLSVSTDGTRFVACGGAGIYSSSDGATWTKRTSALPDSQRKLGPQFENVSSGAFANNQFYVLGIYGSITTSPDGTTWTRRSTGTVNDLFGVIHDGIRFVATGSGGTVLTSPDGSTWTQVTSGTTAHFGRLAYNGTRYVTADYSGIQHSTNLTSWTGVSGTTSDRYYGVAYGNNRFVAIREAIVLGTRTSTDGATWSSANGITGARGNVSGLVFGNGVFVISAGGFGASEKLYSSTDGISWADRTPTLPAGAAFQSLAFGNGRFVALTGNRYALTSTDGITWTAAALPSSFSLSYLYFVGTKFVARSTDYGAKSYTSSDGVAWTALENSLAPNAVMTGMVASGSTVVAIANSGIILRGDLAGAAPVVTTTLTATSVPSGATVQWQRNGTNVSGATSGSLSLTDVQPATAGLYTSVVTSGTTVTTQAFVVGATSTDKVTGTGAEVGPNITPVPGGNTYDQVLLQGAAATITADTNQITRISYIDLSDDIVQVEYSGPGTLSLVVDGAGTPAAPTKYNQTVSYVKGHAGIVITGATADSNVTIFTVGTATAVNQALFKSGTTYDGMADVAYLAISSTDGKFGGIRAANASFLATKGYTGVYAPGVAFSGPVYVGDINASDAATPVLVIGSAAGETRITGGDLLQSNGATVSVAGLTQLRFTAGTNSHGVTYTAQNNRAVLKQGTTDVTSTVVVNPTTTGGTTGGTVSGPELTYFASGSNPPYANGAKKRFEGSLTTLRFDSTTLTTPAAMTTLSSPYTGATFTEAATGLTWELILKNGVVYEINLMRSGAFVGQWQ